MKAQSKVYIQLQGIYKAKARKDAAEILQIVQATPGGERVDPAEVDLFCKNAAFVKLINATGGTGSEISRTDRLKSAAGKQMQNCFPVTPPWRGLEPFWVGQTDHTVGLHSPTRGIEAEGKKRARQEASERERRKKKKRMANQG